MAVGHDLTDDNTRRTALRVRRLQYKCRRFYLAQYLLKTGALKLQDWTLRDRTKAALPSTSLEPLTPSFKFSYRSRQRCKLPANPDEGVWVHFEVKIKHFVV